MLHTQILRKYCPNEMSSEHLEPCNTLLFWLVLQTWGQDLASISNFGGYDLTSGIRIRKQPRSLTEQQKSHENKCVTVIILFLSVFQRKKLMPTGMKCPHKGQAARPECISGYWMWHGAKIHPWWLGLVHRTWGALLPRRTCPFSNQLAKTCIPQMFGEPQTRRGAGFGPS